MSEMKRLTDINIIVWVFNKCEYFTKTTAYSKFIINFAERGVDGDCHAPTDYDDFCYMLEVKNIMNDFAHYGTLLKKLTEEALNNELENEEHENTYYALVVKPFIDTHFTADNISKAIQITEWIGKMKHPYGGDSGVTNSSTHSDSLGRTENNSEQLPRRVHWSHLRFKPPGEGINETLQVEDADVTGSGTSYPYEEQNAAEVKALFREMHENMQSLFKDLIDKDKSGN